MSKNKLEAQYRWWVCKAIDKARKDPRGYTPYQSVIPQLSEDKANSFRQWAMAEGWLHSAGEMVYETSKTKNFAICEILHEINNFKD